MTRLRYLYSSLGLVALLSVVGLYFAPAGYQSWVAGHWMKGELNPVFEYFYRLQVQQDASRQTMDIWLPFKVSIVAILAPAVPAFLRLKTLGLSPLWGVLGFLPGLNFLFFAYLAIRVHDESDGQRLSWPQRAAVSGAFIVTGYLLYYLLIYVPWLAAMS
jgi:hypothetical protein